MSTTVADTGLITRIFAEAEARPEAPALIGARETLSYGELAVRVGHIAAALRRAGVDPEAAPLVGVCLPRSVEAVCVVLGVVAAGGVYVPIALEYPLETRRRMAASAGLTHIVTETDDFADLVPRCLTPALSSAGGAPIAPASVGGDHLLHVLYTSGSTGEPKGVLGTHGQMRARLAWLWHALPLGPGDVCCHKTALHFVDASLEIFGTLAKGRPLVLAPDVSSADAESFVELLARRGVTRLSLVVSQLRSLLLAAPDLGARLPALELWIVSGERLPRELVETFREAAPAARLVNLYGCSEVPEVSWAQVAPGGRFEGDAAPIGRLIDGLEAHIVDDALAPVASGAIGELLVGGPISAPGYLDAPPEAAARFIDNPFGGARRLYRTGDRVRQTDDGLLWHEGRADDQVKVRGHRVELGAVEAALGRCEPGLAAVKAVVQEDPRLPENRSIVAFVAPETIDTARLAAQMRVEVPAPMRPQRIIALDALPTTPSGKIDRRRLAALARARFDAAVEGDTQRRVMRLWCRVLMTDRVSPTDRFFDIGGDSLRLAQLHGDLEAAFPSFDLSLPELLAYPTVAAQVAYLERPAAAVQRAPTTRPAGRDIAIIGLACRFPGASTPEAFWADLRDGVDAITDFTDAELEQPDARLRADPDYVKAGAVLDDVAGFDAAFFGMSEAQAARLDPQHRLLLECAWEAMERAALPPGSRAGRVGVFAGSGPNSYYLNQIATPPVTEATMAEYQDNLAADRNFLATRIAYRLGLTGPALTIQSACSTGLVVVHQACQALRAGECEAAIAAAVSIKTPQRAGYLYEEGMIRSPDGRCRAFDAAARGTLFGSGAGVVVLKPLAAAQAAGDPILAVIKGSAVNNDGTDKVGYAAPSVTGQAEVVAAALTAAGVDPSSIGYVEAHGTGTRIGDPVEISALTRAYRRLGWTPGAERTPIGSVKTNIGHLDEAAGMAGLIKTALMLQHREIAPSLHFEAANPAIDFEASPFEVATRRTPWRRPEGALRRAGVSSFGMGGTNAHLIIEEAPAPTPTPPTAGARSRHLLALSAPTPAGLSALAERYRAFLGEAPDLTAADLCATAALGRRHFEHRLAVVGETTESLRDALAARAGDRALGHGPGKLAFVFSGQGAQYLGMARGLYDADTPFRATLDRCAAILDPLLPRPLLEVMFDGATDTRGAPLLSQTQYTQPALVAVEAALVALWRAWGVHPDIVLGHSVGEYTAAYTAGVFDLPAVLTVVAERGRLMQALPGGAGMLAVNLDETEAEAIARAHPGTCIAAVNAAGSVVFAGDERALAAVTETLSARGVRSRRLDVSHAFHSPAMEPMLEPLEAEIGRHRLTAPSLPVVSNIDGRLAHDPTDPAYWARHTRAPVRFVDGVRALDRYGVDTVIEIGPAAPLLGLIARGEAPSVLLPSLRRRHDDWAQMLDSLARLYEQGREIEWERVFAGQPGRKRRLPTMPFQRRRCWIDRPAPTRSTAALESALRVAAERLAARGALTPAQAAHVTQVAAEVLAEVSRPSDWTDLVYRPAWVATAPPPVTARGARWLILADRGGVGAALAERARAEGLSVTCVAPGAPLPPGETDRIVHLRALDFPGDGPAAQHAVVESVSSLMPWLTAEAAAPVSFVTRGAQSHDGLPGGALAQALVWGLARTLALEGTLTGGGLIDLDPTAEAAAVESLWHALLADERASEQALCRGATRYTLRLEPAAPPTPPAIRADATYLITGGLGALGLEAAEVLADLGACHLVLVSRRGPAGEARSARLDALRRRGVTVATPTADVADEEAMRAVFEGLEGDLPPLRGVIHAAGVIADRPESTPSAGRVAATLRAKVDGAVILDRLTHRAALDLFVLFSSAAGLLGLSGHADYAAANAALDALAARRRARGAPALSLDWGDWAGLGMARGVPSADIAAETGLGALSRGVARAALRGLLGAQGQWAVINADWPAFVAAFGAHARLLAPCLTAGAAGGEAPPPAPPGSAPPGSAPLGSPSVEPATPADRITRLVATLLGRAGATLDRDESLLGLGFDSLMLINLRNQLRRELGLRVPLPRMLRGPSIAALAAEVDADEAQASDDAPPADAPDEPWTTITL